MNIHLANAYLSSGRAIRREDWPADRFMRACRCGCDLIFDSFRELPDPKDIFAEDWEVMARFQ